jgi:hypothetical protein
MKSTKRLIRIVAHVPITIEVRGVSESRIDEVKDFAVRRLFLDGLSSGPEGAFAYRTEVDGRCWLDSPDEPEEEQT